MVFLWILLGIVLFFMLIGAVPLRLRILLDGRFTLCAGIGPLTLFRMPKKQKPIDLRDFTYKKHQKRLAKERAARLKKKQKKQQSDAKKQQKNNAAEKVKETAEQSGNQENKLEGILSLVGCILDGLPGLFGGCQCRIYSLDVTVGGKEAADTARNFGIYSQSLAYLLEFLDAKTHFVRPEAETIAIRADFLAEKTQVKADFTLQIRVGQLFGTAFGILFSYIKTMIRS